MLGPAGRGIRIISKVENQEGIQNFDEILDKVRSLVHLTRCDISGASCRAVGCWVSNLDGSAEAAAFDM